MSKMILVWTVALVTRPAAAEMAPRETFEAAVSECATANGVTLPARADKGARTESFREHARPSAEDRAKMKTVFDCAKTKVEAQGYEAPEPRGPGGGREGHGPREGGGEGHRPPPPAAESDSTSASTGDM